MRSLASSRLLLDAGALRHAERWPHGDVWIMCRDEVAMGQRPLLPITVLAQMWRGGGGQAGLHRVVKTCEIVHIDEILAKRVGALLGESGSSDIVDAMVVLIAVDKEAAVVTSDPGDIAKLAEAAGADLSLLTI